VADRADRRRLMVGADLVRVGSLAALTAAVLGGRASIPALVALLFVNAAAETVFDTAWQSTLPAGQLGHPLGGGGRRRRGRRPARPWGPLRRRRGRAPGLAGLAWRLLDAGSFAAARAAAGPSPEVGPA
jgi:hypothetical protein